MNLTRTVGFCAAAGGLAALVAGATSGGRRLETPRTAPPSSGVETSTADLAAEIERLHERLRPTAVPQQPARNLFQFHQGRSAPGIRPPEAPLPSETPAVQNPPPALQLIGIAEDAGADGVAVRTAIVSGLGQLFLVKEGDSMTDRYRVSRISSEAIELVDTSGGTPLRLALK
jgi:hypothetical protein